MRKRNTLNRSVRGIPVVQSLEARQLLSVAPIKAFVDDGGNLIVQGSSSADVISLQVNTDSVRLTKGVGVKAQQKLFGNVQRIQLDGNGGADKLSICGAGDESVINLNVSGGNGNDQIVVKNYNGEIYISGDNGDDNIDLRRVFAPNAILGNTYSYRNVFGGVGNDTIYGSSADDGIYSGDGNDRIYGGAGDDYINGGRGRNVINGGAGDDQFYVYSLQGATLDEPNPWNTGGYDTIDGGVGSDTLQFCWNSRVSGVLTGKALTKLFGATSTRVEQSFFNDWGASEKG